MIHQSVYNNTNGCSREDKVVRKSECRAADERERLLGGGGVVGGGIYANSVPAGEWDRSKRGEVCCS